MSATMEIVMQMMVTMFAFMEIVINVDGDNTDPQDGKTWVDHPFKPTSQNNCQPRTEWNPGAANRYHTRLHPVLKHVDLGIFRLAEGKSCCYIILHS